MNKIIEEYYSVFQMYQELRTQLLDSLSNEDLAFSPGGNNPTLGALCREIGEVQQAYIDSFKTLTQNFDYRHDDPTTEASVERLQAWFADLDAELKAIIEAFTDEDLQTKIIDRGHDFKLPIQIQLEVYKEALLIFYGKTMVYLKAMEKTPPGRWSAWIA